MSVINRPPTTLTKEQALDQGQATAADANVKGIRQMFSNWQTGMDAAWSSLHYTPQEFFNRYGANATQMCIDSRETIDFINKRCLLPDGTVDPRLASYVITKGYPDDKYDLTFNEDGTVNAKPKLYFKTRPGALVTLSSGETATADDSGNAMVILPVEGDYTGTATLNGYDPSTFSVSVSRGGQEVRTYPVQIMGTLIVTGPAGAMFTLSKTDGTEVASAPCDPANEGDANGQGSMSVPPGDYVLTSVLAEYTDTPVNITLTRDGASVNCGLSINS